MYDKLSKLLDEQRILYKQYTSSADDFQRQEIRSSMGEKFNEMNAILKVIGEIEDKKYEDAKYMLPPLPPRLKVTGE
jgi:hypothetical protein